MTTALTSSPRVALRVLRVVERLEAQFPTLPVGTVVRCVEAARVSARTSLSDPQAYAGIVEELARVDLAALQLVSGVGKDSSR